jgi:hypothetical protein
MNRLIVSGSLLLLTCISGQATAAPCDGPSRVTGAALSTLISGNTVCATRGADRWQEQHRTGGQLWDYKKGPTDPVDPTTQVGTWSISGNNVTYSYMGEGPVPSYTYSVHGSGTYSFCTRVNGSEIVSGAIFLPGSTSCP